MKKYKIPDVLSRMNRIFSENGFKAYLVGGAVRDMIMGKEAHDWDVATDASPSEVMSIFRKVVPTGIAHGTVTVHFSGHEIEVSTFRTEDGYTDGRHPDRVSFTSDIEEDLARRDFTMNAIAISLEDGHMEDPFGGIHDIRKKTVRTVGKPVDRFCEDGLRPVRAIRFSSTLEFAVEAGTLDAISEKKVAEKIRGISQERFRDELMKLLGSKEPSRGLKLMEETGILEMFIPELSACRGCVQGDSRGFHEFDVLDHLFYACDGAPSEKPLVRLSALLHDIGKPAVKKTVFKEGAESITFYGHERVGAKISRDLLARLKFSNAQMDAVSHLVENHMFHYESNWTDSAVRRFISRVGVSCMEDLFDLRLADVYGMHRKKMRLHDSLNAEGLLELKRRVEDELEKKSALTLKDLAVNGKTLMSLGIPPGRDIGKILESLLETVLDDPVQNTEERLSAVALGLWNRMNGR